MNIILLPPEQICALLIVHSNSHLGRPINSYGIIRLLSRLFGVIDFKAVENLAINDYLQKTPRQTSDYHLTETGLALLMKYKSQLLEYLQAEGYITTTFG
ncbi:MAG: hypothetical protein EOO55_00490 [Hymenobacter sp.]|nr:MAG: hypothetical protein EOO55_00490 [Hymenobacter sp.]